MEGIEHRTVMRARRGLAVLDRLAEQLLSDDVPRVPLVWGEPGPDRGRPTIDVPQARRADGRTPEQGRDVVAERERIRAELHRAHQRRARRRRTLVRLG
ncbi:MAG: hypothetical protein ACXV2H_05155 [Actinomycetes bacterium]